MIVVDVVFLDRLMENVHGGFIKRLVFYGPCYPLSIIFLHRLGEY